MKSKALILTMIVSWFFACQYKTSPDFSWLEGNWIRLNNSKGTETVEIWQKVGEKQFKGLGCTLQNGDTVFKEQLRITELDGSWVYEVSGVNEYPTIFRMSLIEDNHFVSENSINEFPKRIEYQLENGKLRAIVSNEESSLEFIFRNKN